VRAIWVVTRRPDWANFRPLGERLYLAAFLITEGAKMFWASFDTVKAMPKF
jgi:hypothetical protein